MMKAVEIVVTGFKKNVFSPLGARGHFLHLASPGSDCCFPSEQYGKLSVE